MLSVKGLIMTTSLLGGISWPVYTFNPVLSVQRFTLCFAYYIWILDFGPHREIQLWAEGSTKYVYQLLCCMLSVHILHNGMLTAE